MVLIPPLIDAYELLQKVVVHLIHVEMYLSFLWQVAGVGVFITFSDSSSFSLFCLLMDQYMCLFTVG